MTTYTATYSPEDNKLRLSASTRLDAETYARVKEAGFIWAPKQGIFVTLCANGPRQREAFRDQAVYWEDLPPGSFKEQGTGVNVALMVLEG